MSKTKKKKINKAGVAFTVIVAIAAILICRVIYINVANGEEYSRRVLAQKERSAKNIAGKRGEITDRNGTVLAYSKRYYNLILDPSILLSENGFYKNDTLDAVTKYFDISREDIEKKLEEKPASKYEKMLTELESDTVNKYLDFENEQKQKDKDDPGKKYIAGVYFEDTSKRQYPFGSLACDVIGFSSPSNGGEIGLERAYNDELTETDGLSYTYIDENLETERVVKEPIDGSNIITTLDYGVQNIIEKKIKEYNEKKPSANTAVIVMDPNTGEILGMASYPFFDLNNPRELSVKYKDEEIKAMDEEQKTEAILSIWSNFCTSQLYEPGSTFKAVTIASALEEEKVKDGDSFYCSGSKNIDIYNVKCWRSDRGGHGQLELEEALADSCNVALMEIGAKLGAETMIKYEQLFGFGKKTGIDLPGEEKGIIYSADDMGEIDIATNSFGQSINVNMVQMISAYASLVNGGYYYQPHVVKAITDSSGKTLRSIDPTVVRRTITKETSDTIKKYLESGVEKYAVQYSKVEGYSMGGKTATAQKIPREEKKWVISVMSFAPVQNPKFLLYVLIDEPDGTTGGSGDGMDSQTLTKSIMTELLPYMEVPRTDDGDASEENETGAEEGVDVPENVAPENEDDNDPDDIEEEE